MKIRHKIILTILKLHFSLLSDYMLLKLKASIAVIVRKRKLKSDIIISRQKIEKRNELFATDFAKIKTYNIMLVNGFEHQLKINLN